MGAQTTEREAATSLEPRRMRTRKARAMLGVLAAASKITAQADASLRELGTGLHGREWDLLVTLYVYGPRHAPELVRRAPSHAAPSTAHAMLNRLRTKGLVDRTTSTVPAYSVVWSLTAEGSETVERLYPILEREVIDRFGEHFSDVELDIIRALMSRI